MREAHQTLTSSLFFSCQMILFPNGFMLFRFFVLLWSGLRKKDVLYIDINIRMFMLYLRIKI